MADPNRAYMRPRYSPPRLPQRVGGHLVPLRPFRWPPSPSVQSELSSAVPNSSPTLSGFSSQAPIAPPARGERPPESQQPGDMPEAIRQLIGMRPIDLVFQSPFIRPIAPPRAAPNDGGYIPMGRWPTWYARNALPPTLWRRQLEITGISQNYGGNIFLPANQSANIPEELSTSLWLTNLPPDCTHQLLLGSIRGCGKIYAAVINPPVYNRNDFARGAPHITSASKLVFFDRSGLERLLAKSQAGEFSVGGYIPRVRMNRIKSAPREPGAQSRVLHIEGPTSIVNETFLNTFFQSKFTYELDLIKTVATHGNWTRQEWRFGSYRCQAESARQSIAREKTRLNMSEVERHRWSEVKVHFGVDPCA
ncbi:hypothetical protein K449DRAFT_453149 [Hypoxylon sp. EC38]|nr:hypothetical protein K449DRAFT_453149 [Hypoxylon sp. EC38]